MPARFRTLLPALFVLAIASCGGSDPDDAGSAKSDPVPFADLDWKDDVFYLENQPFTGTAVAYFKDGKTKKSVIGLREGVYHGIVREWWENGKLQTETAFSKGKRHGKNTYWDEEGNLIKEQVYDMDTVVEEKVHQ